MSYRESIEIPDFFYPSSVCVCVRERERESYDSEIEKAPNLWRGLLLSQLQKFQPHLFILPRFFVGG
ncbi:hypothetical protein IHE45_02G091400 [Dioscorea alata]|uniref:Uncharacterized protein n=1 Tax=Dioscorea alata TaxID=55571 RepID=A0ACB7WRE5_DIOAL|nr:hypothetical protein IHE45_02G091400 [Dioscorea alata]